MGTTHSNNYRDLLGHVFGRWTVIEYAGRYRGYGGAVWKCRCQCGKEKLVRAEQLSGGGSRSCGCISSEIISERNRRSASHGHTRNSTTSTEYKSWASMKSRCCNHKDKDYHRYGARGIKVCERWMNSFENFLADMGLKPSVRHTIDRFPNNDGDYEPGNCRWATAKQQSNNTRSNRLLLFDGRIQTTAQWCDELGISRDTVAHRLADGWSIAKALLTPIRSKRQRSESNP